MNRSFFKKEKLPFCFGAMLIAFVITLIRLSKKGIAANYFSDG